MPREAAKLQPVFLLLGSLVALMVLGCERVEVRETYPAGNPMREDLYRPWGPRDSLHRIGVKTFHFNGHPDFEAEYRNGVRHGSFREYWHNGQIKCEGRFVRGMKQGMWKYYWNRFQLSSQGQYRDDLKDGFWTEYFENGELRKRGAYSAGQPTGKWEGFNFQGDPIWISSCFTRNDTGHYRSMYPGGKIEESYACKKGKPIGPYAKLDRGGDTLISGSYSESGHKTGTWRTVSESGRLLSLEHFQNGLWNDSVLFLDSAGRMREAGLFNQGTGSLKAFDTLGQCTKITPYSHGQKQGEVISFHADGHVAGKWTYQDDTLQTLAQFHPNGSVSLKGNYVHGRREGLWMRYHANGKLAERSHYVAGVLEGEQEFFDSTGVVTQKIRYEHGYPAEGKFKGVPGVRSTSGKFKME